MLTIVCINDTWLLVNEETKNYAIAHRATDKEENEIICEGILKAQYILVEDEELNSR